MDGEEDERGRNDVSMCGRGQGQRADTRRTCGNGHKHDGSFGPNSESEFGNGTCRFAVARAPLPTAATATAAAALAEAKEIGWEMLGLSF